MEALFVVFRSDGQRHDFHIEPGKRYVIGRNESCQFRVPMPSVSREHAAVFFDEEEELVIEDLGSSNGTFVNQERIDGKEELTPGDVVQIGEVPFQVVIDGHPTDLEPLAMGKSKRSSPETHTQIGSGAAAASGASGDEEPDISRSGGIEEDKDSNIDSFFGFDLDDSDI